GARGDAARPLCTARAARQGRRQRPGGGGGRGDVGGGTELRMSAFLWRYLRFYTGWALLAASGILVYAAATAGAAALIKPIFAEVLLAGEDVPSPVGALTASAPPQHQPAKRQEAGILADLKKRFDLSRQLDRSYASLKR